MIKCTIMNTRNIDVIVDTQGLGKVEDKVILHPKNKTQLTLKDKSVLDSVKSIKGLVINLK